MTTNKVSATSDAEFYSLWTKCVLNAPHLETQHSFVARFARAVLAAHPPAQDTQDAKELK